MSWISTICFAACVGIIASSVRKDRDMLSPGRVFGFIWCFVIGLADLKLSSLQRVWTTDSWIQVLVGPASLFAGLFVVYVLNLNQELLSIGGLRSKLRTTMVLDARRMFRIIIALFILFLGAYGSLVLLGKQIPLLSLQPGLARLEFQAFGLGLLLHNVEVIVILSALYWFCVEATAGKKRVLFAISFISIILYTLTLQRFQILMAIIICLMIVYYSTDRLRLWMLFAFGLTAIAFFYWISATRGGSLFVTYLYRASQMKFDRDYAILTEPYMYFVMSSENFARALPKLDHYTFGYYSGNFLLSLVGLKHWIAEYFNIVETPYLISGYNTYTTFWWFYRDFGIMGVWIIPFLYGLVTGSVYSAMRREPSPQSVIIYCILAFVLLFSFYDIFLTLLWFVYDVCVILLVLRTVRRVRI